MSKTSQNFTATHRDSPPGGNFEILLFPKKKKQTSPGNLVSCMLIIRRFLRNLLHFCPAHVVIIKLIKLCSNKANSVLLVTRRDGGAKFVLFFLFFFVCAIFGIKFLRSSTAVVEFRPTKTTPKHKRFTCSAGSAIKLWDCDGCGGHEVEKKVLCKYCNIELIALHCAMDQVMSEIITIFKTH